MAGFALEFERPIVELEEKIGELKRLSAVQNMDFSKEVARLQEKVAKLCEEVFSCLTPWQRCQIARHPNRPYTLDYISM
ncbi:MAG: acetyl-CoA carboxylase carboxyl transferase subunit alpha, partial [Candidatus Methylomirabilis sp.]